MRLNDTVFFGGEDFTENNIIFWNVTKHHCHWLFLGTECCGWDRNQQLILHDPATSDPSFFLHKGGLPCHNDSTTPWSILQGIGLRRMLPSKPGTPIMVQWKEIHPFSTEPWVWNRKSRWCKLQIYIPCCQPPMVAFFLSHGSHLQIQDLRSWYHFKCYPNATKHKKMLLANSLQPSSLYCETMVCIFVFVCFCWCIHITSLLQRFVVQEQWWEAMHHLWNEPNVVWT